MKTVEPLSRPGQGSKKFFSKLYRKFKELPTGPRMAIDVAIIISIFSFLVLITPSLRYGLLNLFSDASVTVELTDSADSFPIYEAKVFIDDEEYVSNTLGVVEVDDIPFGEYEVRIEKEGYTSVEQELTIGSSQVNERILLDSKGRRITIHANEFLSDNPVESFIVRTTGDNPTSTVGAYGVAVLSLPTGVTLEFGGLIEAENFSDLPITIDARQQENDYQLIPSGEHFFLDSRGGTTTIYSSDLDGGNEQRFIEPTGFESSNSKLFTDPNGNYALYEAARRQEIVNGRQLNQLYSVNLRTGDILEVNSGAQSWQVVDIDKDRVIYVASKDDPSQNDNQALIRYDFNTNETKVLFASKEITFSAAINGKAVVAEMIERGSYPGGYLLRQLIAIDEQSEETTTLSEDATITDLKVVTPTKIQYSLINPQTKAEVKFVYDTELNEPFQASIDRSQKQVAEADFADNSYSWTVQNSGGTRLVFGNKEGEVSIYYEIPTKGLNIKQWLDSKYIILHTPDNAPNSKGLVLRIDNGKSASLP